MSCMAISTSALPLGDVSSALTNTPAEACGLSIVASVIFVLAATTGIGVSIRFPRLAFHFIADLERFQDATGPCNNFSPGTKPIRDFNIGFTGNAGSHFDKFNLVVFIKNVDAFLFLWFLANWSGRAAGDRGTGRRRGWGFFNDCLKRHGNHVILGLGSDGRGRAHAGTELVFDVISQ